MNSFAFVLLLAAAATASVVPSAGIKSFMLYGSPAAAAAGIRGVADVDALPSEMLGWRSVYDKPVIMAVKQDGKPEMAAFLLKNGLAGLAHSTDMRFLHDLLRTGAPKAGVLLGAAKYLAAPELEMPITKMFLPQGWTLATAARIQAEHGALPWMMVASMDDLKAAGLAKLALMGDFIITEDSVKVATDIPAPAMAAHIAAAARVPSYATPEIAATAGLSAIASPAVPAALRGYPVIAKYAPTALTAADALYPAYSGLSAIDTIPTRAAAYGAVHPALAGRIALHAIPATASPSYIVA